MPTITPTFARRLIAALTLLMLMVFAIIDILAPAGRGLVKISGDDTVNYFDISHSILFDHDVNLNNEYQHVPPADREWTPTNKQTGLPGNPWGLGFSLLAIPFLALGTLLDWAVGNPPDGYHHYAIYVYRLTNVVLTGIGVGILFGLLRDVALYNGADDKRASQISLFTCGVVFAGTNIAFYSISPLSHASTFLLSTIFLRLWWLNRSDDDIRGWFFTGLAGGYLSICRWQEVLHLGGPILYDLLNGKPFRTPLPWFKARLAYALGALVAVLPQLFVFKVLYGKWVTMPQGIGILKFPPAHMLSVLLSTRNGWFLWTPLIALGFLGLALSFARSWRLYVPWLVVFLLELSVIGAFIYWSGIDAFSSRYMVANTVFVSFGLVALLASRSPFVRGGAVLAALACTVFTVLFALQYGLKLVPTDSMLTPTEIFTDKLHILTIKKRKTAVREARELLENGKAAEASAVLEKVLPLGEDRDVYGLLAKAYRQIGFPEKADPLEAKVRVIMAARWP
jgi:hypothetical protein